MKTFNTWLDETYPNHRASELGKMKVEWLEYAVSELSAELEALKPKPIPIIDNPLVCHCEDFVGEEFECERCGGMKF